ncbi:hypothetical protein PTKIN_Ptkin01aG0299500 [Pterospermum kingtungense]
MALLLSTNHRQSPDHHVDSISNPIYRSESFSSGYMEHNYNYNHMMMEKRQVFLRSYQFSRKRSLTEKIKRSLVRVKRVMWFRLRSARKLRRFVLSRLRFAFYRKRRYIRVIYNSHYRHSSCLW